MCKDQPAGVTSDLHCGQVTSVEVCTLDVKVDFCLQIDLQIQWPVSKSDDSAPAPPPPADLTPPGISVTTYTAYFRNPYDASLAQATAGDQEAADVRCVALPHCSFCCFSFGAEHPDG